MFNLIDIGERSGSGIPNIMRVWHDEGWETPTIVESTEPDRTSLSLVFIKTSDKKQAINKKTSDKRISAIQIQMIIDYLMDVPVARTSQIADLLQVSPARARALLNKLVKDNVIIADGAKRNRVYRLKS